MATDSKFLRGVPHRDAPSDASLPSLGEIGLNFFVPYLFNRIAASWNMDMAQELRKFDLTTPQMRVLAVLSINSSYTINELAVLTVTEQSTMSRTLDNLEERKLISRRARDSDMRVRDVEMTAKGRQAFESFWPVMFDHYKIMFKDIDGSEFDQLVATLQKVLRNIKQSDEEISE
jgi:MarR family transcriptional regulator, transcriptional regulator for hemolysin